MSTEHKAFIVYRQTGSWDGYTETWIRAFLSEDAAQSLVNKANKWVADEVRPKDSDFVDRYGDGLLPEPLNFDPEAGYETDLGWLYDRDISYTYGCIPLEVI